MLQLSAHAVVNGDVKEALAALDRAHVHVVRVFDEITTEDMHTRWGRSA